MTFRILQNEFGNVSNKSAHRQNFLFTHHAPKGKSLKTFATYRFHVLFNTVESTHGKN